MKLSIKNDQRGVGHVLVIILIAVVVGAIGFVAWKVFIKDKAADTVTSQASKQAEAECNKEMDDKDICKFLSSWDQSQQYRVASTSTAEGVTTKSTFEIDGDKSYIKIEGDAAYEVITIGDTTYTKAGDIWYKQTTTTEEADLTKDYKVDFDEPDTEATESTTTYKSLGKEACGDKQCFKYQVIDTANAETTEYIWFDDDDYKLRRTRSEGKDGSVNESTYEYDNVNISEPSPVQELGPNQYVVPGSTEVMTVPGN